MANPGDLAAKAVDMVKNADLDGAKAAVAGGVEHIKGMVDAAVGLWGTFDKDGDGKLTITEALELLNSKQLGDAVTKATGLPHTQRTEADIKAWFNRADFDKSSTLSKREFAVMYAGILAEKAKGGVGGMAQAVCAALDRDGDGQIGSKELKALLANTPLGMLANMIPDAANVNYRDIFAKAK